MLLNHRLRFVFFLNYLQAFFRAKCVAKKSESFVLREPTILIHQVRNAKLYFYGAATF